MSTTDEAMVATSETQALEDVQDVPSTSCRICMSDQLQHPARIQSCGHCFWSVTLSTVLGSLSPFRPFHRAASVCSLECIRQWSRSSPEPRCPLCNASFSVLVHSGTEEVRFSACCYISTLCSPFTGPATYLWSYHCVSTLIDCLQELPLSSQQRAKVEGTKHLCAPVVVQELCPAAVQFTETSIYVSQFITAMPINAIGSQH